MNNETRTTGPLTNNEKRAAKAHTDRLIAAWEANRRAAGASVTVDEMFAECEAK